MSEYIEIDADVSEDGRTIVFQTNLPLTEAGETEIYASAAEMDEGSPVAQFLAGIPGIAALRLIENSLVIRCDTDADATAIIVDVSAALKDFFL